ncbi:MAG: M48 family metallopeptidase [Candidatus Amulumruptor caecigallinarius]|nr:M48 family metallopeptidase [Candidatus Amulumruptor caecigallinarius]MCM1396865.1 M48 family metallopeptidase [Candidatus Amulumruptor caecigallinarius]MCM1454191.1 M48 family metallopeptidase [bacterium]
MKRLRFLTATLAAAMLATAPAAEAFDLETLVGSLGKAYQAYNISDGEVRQYVTQAVTEMDGDNKVLPESSPYTKRLRRVTFGLTSIDGIPLNFKVYQTSDVNAFACADGSVRVYTGLMDLMDDNELLGVIGHELGHVALHHSRNAMRNALLTSAGKDALGSVGGIVGSLSKSQLGALGETLINSSYSRKQESEADDYGYDFLKQNGKNPWAMALAFSKLSSIEQQGGAASDLFTRIFSDHPDTQSRISHMAERATKDGFARPTASTSATASKSTNSSATSKKSATSSAKQVKRQAQSASATGQKTTGGFHLEQVQHGSIGNSTERAIRHSTGR